jgi:diphosphoinositol-polyphosphate diphosphatase
MQTSVKCLAVGSNLHYADRLSGYGPRGERLVAGVVPLKADKSQVLLIQSTRRNGWVLPKGGWELDEPTASAAAQREAWEEAGIIVKVEKDLGHIADTRPTTALTKNAPKASYQFFEATVTEEKAEWPEKHKRNRQWYSYAQAIQIMDQRPELLEALKRSSIKK